MAFNLLVAIPLTGVLVRWRAHYTPKRARNRNRAGEGQQQQEQEVRGYFTILQRVYAIEGLSGFYKGLVPNILSFVCTMAVMTLFFPRLLPFVRQSEDRGDAKSGTDNIFLDPNIALAKRLAYWTTESVFSIPLQIITNRAITTSYKLPWASPTKSLNVLLSQAERRSPWKLYLLPGYTLSRAVMLAFWLGVGPIRHVLLPDVGKLRVAQQALLPYLLFGLLSALVQTPLQVAGVRLSLQRNQDTESVGGGGRSEEQVSDVERYSTEDVIVVKDTYRFPYSGLVDCFDTIINEESWKTLLKSGWLTFMGM
ncbi:hypothetical protein V5O48_014460 [Marasmius crinis-equi]|uniref:Mitochondrial carrier n=1 Tax=Marasmius crinis-equi TaxID=585013 RepID=A0ABR3EX99_9AGAR